MKKCLLATFATLSFFRMDCIATVMPLSEENKQSAGIISIERALPVVFDSVGLRDVDLTGERFDYLYSVLRDRVFSNSYGKVKIDLSGNPAFTFDDTCKLTRMLDDKGIHNVDITLPDSIAVNDALVAFSQGAFDFKGRLDVRSDENYPDGHTERGGMELEVVAKERTLSSVTYPGLALEQWVSKVYIEPFQAKELHKLTLDEIQALKDANMLETLRAVSCSIDVSSRLSCDETKKSLERLAQINAPNVTAEITTTIHDNDDAERFQELADAIKAYKGKVITKVEINDNGYGYNGDNKEIGMSVLKAVKDITEAEIVLPINKRSRDEAWNETDLKELAKILADVKAKVTVHIKGNFNDGVLYFSLLEPLAGNERVKFVINDEEKNITRESAMEALLFSDEGSFPEGTEASEIIGILKKIIESAMKGQAIFTNINLRGVELTTDDINTIGGLHLYEYVNESWEAGGIYFDELSKECIEALRKYKDDIKLWPQIGEKGPEEVGIEDWPTDFMGW